MSDFPEGADWWKATDGRWYSPPASSDGAPPADAPSTSKKRTTGGGGSGHGCLVGIAIVVVIIVAAMLGGGGDDDGDSGGGGDEPSGEELRYGAFDVCTQFVEDRLRAPGTASFPNEFEDDGEVVISGGPATFTVRSHVDAENAFGGEVRTPFVCEVRHTTGSSFTLVNLEMG